VEGPSWMMVLLLKQVHLQKDGGARVVVSSRSMGGLGWSDFLQAASARFNRANITIKKEIRCILKLGGRNVVLLV